MITSATRSSVARPSLSRLAEPAPIVVYTGRLDEVKGIRCLLQAWPLVRARYETATLIVVGDGSLRQVVDEHASAGVVATGRVADVKPYLEAADAFVLPSRSEASSIALLEAMAVGLPVVATGVGGTLDLIADGDNGLLVAPEDPGALARGLLRLLDEPGRRRAMGEAARRAVLDSHRVETRVERLVELYRSVIAVNGTA